MEKKLKVGIIGIGNMGSGHANNILTGNCPELDLVAIADKDPARLDWAREQYKDHSITYFDTAEAMLDSGLLECCIVAVPHYDHVALAIACMERSIHVMLEKPAGVYTRQVRKMNAVADQHPEVVFGLMYNERTDHIYRKVHELVHSGKYGQIRRTNWIITTWYRSQAYYNSGSWRATWSGEGGGVLLNQCPHQLDIWQWICGMPSSVEAHLHFGKWHDIEVEDDVTAYVEYPNGATGVFITSTGDACGSNRLEIQMDKAKIVSENGKITVTEYEKAEQEFSAENKVPFARMPVTEFVAETDGGNEQHKGVLNAWAGAILRGTPLIADGREGINGLTISNAMHLSSFTGKKIDLPLDEDLYYEELMKRVKTSRRKTTVEQAFSTVL